MRAPIDQTAPLVLAVGCRGKLRSSYPNRASPAKLRLNWYCKSSIASSCVDFDTDVESVCAQSNVNREPIMGSRLPVASVNVASFCVVFANDGDARSLRRLPL